MHPPRPVVAAGALFAAVFFLPGAARAATPDAADDSAASDPRPLTHVVSPPPPPAIRTPIPGTPPLLQGQYFVLDPVADGAFTVVGLGFSFLLGEILSTGEIRPPQISVSSSSLLPIDRSAVTQTIDKNAGTLSDIGLGVGLGFAALDPILSGFRDGWDAALVDGFIYAESASFALALTDITKIAVRRPRPLDYIRCPVQNGQPNTGPDCQSTDLGLSFWSGHAAAVSAVGATATYLAFMRDPKSARPWITLGLATALTAFVSIERVRAGEHFPTDVIAGSLAGTAIGVLVPHLHRHAQDAPVVWVGAAPVPGGATLGVNGFF